MRAEALRRFGVDLRRCLVEKNVPGVELLQLRHESRHRHDRLHAGILQDEGDALVRETGVERNIGGIHFHHCEQRDVGVHALVEDQADAVAGLDALLKQKARDLIGAFVEIAEGVDPIVGDDGFALAVA